MTKTAIHTAKLQHENPKLTKVAEGGSAAPGRGVTVINTSHHQQLLGDRGRHDPCTAGSRDQTHQDGSTPASDLQKRQEVTAPETHATAPSPRPGPAGHSHLARHGVGLADLVPPIASSYRYDGQFGQNDRPANSGGNFFRAFNTKTNVAVVVPDSNESLGLKREVFSGGCAAQEHPLSRTQSIRVSHQG